MGTWAFGGLITLGVFVLGGLIAAVRSVTRLNTTMGFLAPALTEVVGSVKVLSSEVNKLGKQVAILELAAAPIPEMREAIGRLETQIAVLSDKY